MLNDIAGAVQPKDRHLEALPEAQVMCPALSHDKIPRACTRGCMTRYLEQPPDMAVGTMLLASRHDTPGCTCPSRGGASEACNTERAWCAPSKLQLEFDHVQPVVAVIHASQSRCSQSTRGVQPAYHWMVQVEMMMTNTASMTPALEQIVSA